MEKRIKATKIEVVPSLPPSDYASSHQNVSKTTRQATSYTHSPPKSESSGGQMVGWIIGGSIILIFFVGILGGGSGSNSSSSSDLDSALQKAGDGRATQMTGAEMDAFRIEQQRISDQHKRQILNGLTPEEKTLRDYEDRMILQGETRSNPHYEELQRRASQSR